MKKKTFKYYKIDLTNDGISVTLAIDLVYYKTGFVLAFKK